MFSRLVAATCMPIFMALASGICGDHGYMGPYDDCICQPGWGGSTCVYLSPTCTFIQNVEPLVMLSLAQLYELPPLPCKCITELFDASTYDVHTESVYDIKFMTCRGADMLHCFNELQDAEIAGSGPPRDVSNVISPCLGYNPNLKLIAVSASECPDSCNGNGVCTREVFTTNTGDAYCRCLWGMIGVACAMARQTTCINKCSGNGMCRGTFCICIEGWFGLDCSMPLRHYDGMYQNAIEHLPETKLRIFVYTLPGHLTQSVSCGGETTWYCGDELYAAHFLFLSILLHDRATITYDPNEADLYYAPLFPYGYNGNVGNPLTHIMNVLFHIKNTYPYWKRASGRDHIWWLIGDRHTCFAPEDIRQGIILGHWGRLDAAVAGGMPCVDMRKDIIVPPLTIESLGNSEVLHQEYGVRSAKEVYIANTTEYLIGANALRTTLLFFAGSSNIDDRDVDCYKPDVDSKHCRDLYSMGIRQTMFLEYAGRADMADVEMHEGSLYGDYGPQLLRSIFCLEVPGYGWSTRIVDYVTHGCIPVIVADDIEWYFQDMIPYHRFALRFSKRDIPHIVTQLRSINSHQLRRQPPNWIKTCSSCFLVG